MADATGGLSSYVSPPDSTGRWFVVTKSIAPWCSSSWSGIRYTVLRPTANPLTPAVLLRGRDPIWFGGDDAGRLRVGAHDFELRFHAESVDRDVLVREWVRHFSVIGNRVIRIPPYAGSARDFAEEWIQSQWRTVAALTAPSISQTLHDKLRKVFSLRYVSVRGCGDVSLTQIAFEDEKSSKNIYLVVKGPDFRMLAVGSTADPTCKGHNQFGGQ